MHVTTMFTLRHLYCELDLVQDLIDIARVANPTNQVLQLAMDRKQNEINDKREKITTAMQFIANRN